MVSDGHSMFELPCGTLLATVSEHGLKELLFLAPEEKQKWRRLSVFERPSLLQRAVLESVREWLQSYLAGEPLNEVRLDLDGTAFQREVWLTLHATSLGETLSYGLLAKKAGHPGASRAVGSAMAANPVTVIVPCHRVVKSDGGLGDYSGYGGCKTKQWLLDHETAFR